MIDGRGVRLIGGRRAAGLAGLVAATCLVSVPACAHMPSPGHGEFYGGALHVATDVEAVLVMLGTALLAGLQPRTVGRWALVATPLAVAAGTAMAPQLGPVASGLPLALVYLMLGAAVAAGLRMNAAVVTLVSLGAGLAIGHRNGSDLGPGIGLGLFAAGSGAATLILIALATAAVLAAVLRVPGARIAARAAGSWIAALGILMTGLAWSGRQAPLSTTPPQTGPASLSRDAGPTLARAADRIALVETGFWSASASSTSRTSAPSPAVVPPSRRRCLRGRRPRSRR